MISLSDYNHEHSPHSIAVSVKDLGLTYTTSIDKKPTLKARLKTVGRGKKHTRIVRALNDVSIDVHYGTVLGIIGSNGAGKSSLMRVISGIVPPTQGRVEVFGSVSTLLALGVGFNPSMTGRDNVYLGGLAAGMSREEIDASFDSIADFSELGESIDAPMRTYSSGMSARLRFAIAASRNHDILIIDEALSVGDQQFRKRSEARMREMRDTAGTVFLVSHSIKSILDTCSRVIWLEKGVLKMDGDPLEVCKAYNRYTGVTSTED